MQRILLRLSYPHLAIVNPAEVGTFYSEKGRDLYLTSILLNYLNNHEAPWVVEVDRDTSDLSTLIFQRNFGCRVININAAGELPETFPPSMSCAARTEFRQRNEPRAHESRIGPDRAAGDVRGAGGADPGMTNVAVSCEKGHVGQVLKQFGIDTVMLLLINKIDRAYDILRSIDFKELDIKVVFLANNCSGLAGFGASDIRQYLITREYEFYARLNNSDDVFVHRFLVSGIPQ